MINIIQNIDYKRQPDESEQLVPIIEDPLYHVVKTIVLAGNSRKANDISAIRISHLTEISRFMIILEGNSRPQNQAIANSVKVRDEILFLTILSIHIFIFLG